MRHAHPEIVELGSNGVSTRSEEVSVRPLHSRTVLLGRDRKVVELQPAVVTRKLHGVARIAGAKSRFTLEEPANPRDRIDDVAMILLNGFGAAEPAYNLLRGHLAARGKRTVTLRPAHSRGLRDLDPTSYFPSAELDSKIAYAVSRELGEEEYDWAGHSLGGGTVADVAEHFVTVKKKPEKVRSAIFIASLGLDGHKRADMLKRGASSARKEVSPVIWQTIKDKDVGFALASMHYVFRNGIRTATVGYAAAGANLDEKLQLLGRHRVKRAALQFKGDCIFPVDGVTARAKHLFDVYRIYDDPTAHHLELQMRDKIDPIAAELIRIVEELHPKPKTTPSENFLRDVA